MYTIYTVKENDTIDTICKKNNYKIEDIYKINNFEPLALIKEGEQIILPTNKKPLFDYYQIIIGDTLHNIAKRFKTDIQHLAIINGLNIYDYIYDKQVILVPKKNIS